jgi:hypothetical protein
MAKQKRITEEEMRVMRALKLSGSTWNEIAAIFGYAASTLRHRRGDIMDGTTNGDKIKRKGFADTVAMHLALTSDSDETRLRAAKLLSGEPDYKEKKPKRSTTIIIDEIMNELRSK